MPTGFSELFLRFSRQTEKEGWKAGDNPAKFEFIESNVHVKKSNMKLKKELITVQGWRKNRYEHLFFSFPINTI